MRFRLNLGRFGWKIWYHECYHTRNISHYLYWPWSSKIARKYSI